MSSTDKPGLVPAARQLEREKTRQSSAKPPANYSLNESDCSPPFSAAGRMSLPKTTYNVLSTSKCTSLSRLVKKKRHELRKSSNPAITGESENPETFHYVRVPIFGRNSRQSTCQTVVQELFVYSTPCGPSSPIAVRPRKKVSFAFKKLAPALTGNSSFVPAAALGSVEECAKTKQTNKSKPTELVDGSVCDMRKIHALLKKREEKGRKSRWSPDKSSHCLANFERKMEERKILTARLACLVGRRVSELMLNANEAVRHKRELQDLGIIYQGPRPLYQIYVLDKKAPVDPERFFQESPYKSVTFTGKPELVKLATAAAGLEVTPVRMVHTKEYSMLNKNMKALHKNCQIDRFEKQQPPDGMRDPDFHELMVVGTSNPEKPPKICAEKSDCLEKPEYFSETDLSVSFIDPLRKSPFDNIREYSEVVKVQPIDPSTKPVLDVSATYPDEVTITRRENGLDVFVKLHCGLHQPPAATTLLLTNSGVEPLEFGLYPVPYADQLWSVQKTGVIYFVEPTGILESGQSHVMTVVFESHLEGTFAEAYRLWTLPRTTTPALITVVVEGRSQPKSYLRLPSTDFVPEFPDENHFLPYMSDQLQDHVKYTLGSMTSENRPSGRVPVEEAFKKLNNLEYQSEGVTRLRYIWLFAHLKHSDIPWYDMLIDRVRQEKKELPGDINKRLLQNLTEIQVKTNHTETAKPDYEDFKIPTDAEGVYWRNPAVVYNCPVHDQDLPLPGITANFATRPPEIPVTVGNFQALSSSGNSTPGSAHTDKPSTRASAGTASTAPRSGQGSTATPGTDEPGVKPITPKVKREKKKPVAEGENDWIPMVVATNSLVDTTALPSNVPHGDHGSKRRKYEMNPDLNPLQRALPGSTDAEKTANKTLMQETWVEHVLDRDWIATAVMFAVHTNDGNLKDAPMHNGTSKDTFKNEETSKNASRAVAPEWNLSVSELREAVQNSQHHISIKLGLLHEISLVEQYMAHIKPSVTLNYTMNDKTEELLAGSMEFVLKRASTYTSNLLAYFGRVCENAKPVEPLVSVDLRKAQEKVKTLEEATSPSVKGSSSKVKKTNRGANDAHTEEASAASKSGRASSNEKELQKSAVPATRSSKTGAVGASKTTLGGQISKKAGVAGIYSERGRPEKEAKLHLAFLEADHEVDLEKYKVKMVEHQRWCKEREAELEPKIACFVDVLWRKELINLDNNVHAQVLELQMEEDMEAERLRKEFLDQRRENTLRKLYDRLLQNGSVIPLAVAAWRSQLTDNIVKLENTKLDRTKGDWELRRKETNIFTKERLNERFRLQLRHIWRAPYTCQTATAQSDLLPLRNRVSRLLSVEQALPPALPPAAVPTTLSLKKEGDSRPKSGMRKVFIKSVKNAPGNTSDAPQLNRSQEITFPKVTSVGKPRLSREEKVVTQILDDFKLYLADIVEEGKNAVEVEFNSRNEWETDDEKVVDAWLYEPVGEVATARLPADFKFVSYKDAIEPQPAPSSGVPRRLKAVRKLCDRTAALEEAGSSSEEEFTWESARRK